MRILYTRCLQKGKKLPCMIFFGFLRFVWPAKIFGRSHWPFQDQRAATDMLWLHRITTLFSVLHCIVSALICVSIVFLFSFRVHRISIGNAKFLYNCRGYMISRSCETESIIPGTTLDLSYISNFNVDGCRGHCQGGL